MSTFAKLTALLLILIPLYALAGVIPKEFNDKLSCIGMYGNGKETHLLYDPDSSTINLDSNIHNIETATLESNGYATVNFDAKDGNYIYLSLIERKDKSFALLRYNAKTNKLLDEINLACHKADQSQ